MLVQPGCCIQEVHLADWRVAEIRFFSFAGRSSVTRWLLAVVTALALLAACVFGLGQSEGIQLVALYTAAGIVIAKLATESARRYHDRGKGGPALLVPLLGIPALLFATMLHWIGYGDNRTHWVMLLLTVIATAATMLRPGTVGSNVYGPSPGRLTPRFHGRSGAGEAVAALIILASIVFGVAVMRWQIAMRRQAEERTRWTADGPVQDDLLENAIRAQTLQSPKTGP